MAVVSSCREVSCQVRQRTRSAPLFASKSYGFVGNSKGTATDKVDEGAGKGRSVCPETPGLHAGCNGMNNGL